MAEERLRTHNKKLAEVLGVGKFRPQVVVDVGEGRLLMVSYTGDIYISVQILNPEKVSDAS